MTKLNKRHAIVYLVAALTEKMVTMSEEHELTQTDVLELDASASATDIFLTHTDPVDEGIDQ